MTGAVLTLSVPAPEAELRDLARNVSKALPKFAEGNSVSDVIYIHSILDPVLDTADLPDLKPGHRAAACNALCAIVEACQNANVSHINIAILDDSIWLRLFNIFLQRSDDAKGKSMRQMLQVFTNLISKDESARAGELREQAASTFLDIICERQDRLKVKPALQGLAHFLLREVVTIAQLAELYEGLQNSSFTESERAASTQNMFKAFLAWVVHHDTSLSAGHLIKNFLLQARKLPEYFAPTIQATISPLWIEPVVWTLQDWPDRMQEFKTHVFPHCFLPDIKEYMWFLSYLRIGKHVPYIGAFPEDLKTYETRGSGLSEKQEFNLLLASLEAGKELSILRDNDYRISNRIVVQDCAIYFPDAIFGAWMSHAEPEVRLAGMFLSVYSVSITRPITGGVFHFLRENLVHLHTDTDANYRREINGYTQKLFDRLRASTATLSKGITKSKTPSGTRLSIPQSYHRNRTMTLKRSQQDPLSEPLAFIVWYIRFLEWELRSTASYQRRITALQALNIVLRSGIDPGIPHSHLSKSAQGQLNWAHGVQTANPQLIRVLLDLVLDPFDDIRGSAVSILQLCLLALPSAERDVVIATIPQFISRAEATMMRTGRADQADGVARAYSLLYSLRQQRITPSSNLDSSSGIEVFEKLGIQLKATLKVAHENLSEAVEGRPVHGTFAALRYIVDQEHFYATLNRSTEDSFIRYRKIHDDLVSDIESLWSCVQHVLCADAPEGHVPDEIEEEASLDTKEILSYSWRGLKEASVLLRTIISKAPIGDKEQDIISVATFQRLGQLCFVQLLDLRHRGAFSTVSQTFSAFCRRCVSSDIPTIRNLPNTWYQETLRSIQAKAGAITRRSAGIPALMAGIVAADSELFSCAMKDLIRESLIEAQSTNIEESRLPQVHALNCLKEFFTTSRLSVVSEAYIGQCLELAAKTLNSKIWPIRNCSLMLFKALIERLLGSDEAQDWKERNRTKTSRFSYDNYPSLVGILTDLLDPEGPLKQSIENTPESGSPLDLHGAEGVFPALQILRQARPPGDALGKIINLVEKLFGSLHWHLRDMSARTIVALRPTHQLYDAVFELLNTKCASHNQRHGALLAVKFMLRQLLADNQNLNIERLESLFEGLATAAREWYTNSNCPTIRSAFLDIVSQCGMTLLKRADAISILSAWETLTHAVSLGPHHALKPSSLTGSALLQQSLAQAYIVDRVILREGALGAMVSEQYQGIDEALLVLAAQDPDTCCTALDSLARVLELRPSNGLAIPLDLVLSHVHNIVLSSTDPEVISKAQAVLADGLNNANLQLSFFGLMTEDKVMESLSKLEKQCLYGPPSNMQGALHLLGFFLDFAYHNYANQHGTILAMIARYIRLLRMTIIDTNPFDTRFAAVQSISTLNHIFSANTTSNLTAPLILGLSIVLYDMLNDDDDEIRDAAAHATATLFRNARQDPTIKDTVPILTCHHLASWLRFTFPHSRDLTREALRRLTNTPPPQKLFGSPFKVTFAQERKEDDALFVIEKQNLYKDDTLDALLWSRVLCTLPPRSEFHKELAQWVQEGLATLTETVRKEQDGALGWSSKPEVFTLGIRVICAAEVVLKWSDVSERADIIKALREFVDLGRRGGVHGLWVEKIERVLEKEVVGMLMRVKGSLPVVQK